MLWKWRITATAVLVFSAVATAGLFPGDQRRFEKLRFGQTVVEVQALYPKMRLLEGEQLGAAVAFSPYIQRWSQPGIKLAGLANEVSLELRFWKERLWVVIAYYGANTAEDITSFLTKRHGAPTSTQPDASWNGKEVVIITSPQERWFSYNDLTLSAEVQAVFMEDLQRSQRARQGQKPALPRMIKPSPSPAAK
jgi:hypothetical protein